MTTMKERELLGLLQEECAEVIQIASKIKRFGFESVNPYKPQDGTNRKLLEDEIGDVRLIVKLLEELDAISIQNVEERMEWKRPKLESQGIAPPSPPKKVMPTTVVGDDFVGVSPMVAPSPETTVMLEVVKIASEIKAVPKTVWKRKYLVQHAAELVALISRMPKDEN